MPDPMNALSESVGIRLDRTEKAVAQNTEAIAQLTKSIRDQSAAIDRLERAVSSVVTGIEAQSENMKAFLALATRQADIISNLTRERAS